MKELDQLKELSNLPLIRAKLDNFIEKTIEEYKKDYTKAEYYDKARFFEKKLNNFNSLTSRIQSNDNFSKSVCTLYLYMDKALFGHFYEHTKTFENLCLKFDKSAYHRGSLEASDLVDAYSNADDSVLDTLENNLELFPKSTRTYLTNKKKKRKNQTFKELKNQFQAKAFVSKFDTDFKISHFNESLNTLNKIDDSMEYFKTLYYFYNAVDSRYNNGKDKTGRVVKFLDKIVSDLYSNSYWYFNELDEDFLEILFMFGNNINFSNSLCKAVIEKDSSSHITMVLLFLCSDEFKKDMKENILNDMRHETGDNYLDLNLVENSFSEIVFKESQRQFFKNYPEVTKFLIDNGYVPTEVDSIIKLAEIA